LVAGLEVGVVVKAARSEVEIVLDARRTGNAQQPA
jgi:hypothetical protein